MNPKQKRNNLFLVLKKPTINNEEHYQKGEVVFQQTKENRMKIKKFTDFSKTYLRHPDLKQKDLFNLKAVNLLNLLNVIFPTPLNRIVETVFPEQQIKKNLKELKRVFKATMGWSKNENFSIKRLVQKTQNEEVKFLNCLLSFKYKIETFGINKDQKQIVRDFYILQGELQSVRTNKGIINFSLTFPNQINSSMVDNKKEISLSWNKQNSNSKNESESENENRIESYFDNWDLISDEDEDEDEDEDKGDPFGWMKNNKTLIQESNEQVYKNIFFERDFQYILQQNNKKHTQNNLHTTKKTQNEKEKEINNNYSSTSSSEWEEYMISKELKETSKVNDFLIDDGFLELSNPNFVNIKKQQNQITLSSSSENYLIDNLINHKNKESEMYIDNSGFKKQQQNKVDNLNKTEEIGIIKTPKKMKKKNTFLRNLMKSLKKRVTSDDTNEKKSLKISTNLDCYDVNDGSDDKIKNDFDDGNNITRRNKNNKKIEMDFENEIENGFKRKKLDRIEKKSPKYTKNMNTRTGREYFKKRGFIFLGKTENHLQLTREFFSIVAKYLLENKNNNNNGGKNEKKKKNEKKRKKKLEKKKKKKTIQEKKKVKGKMEIKNIHNIDDNKIEFFYLINVYNGWASMKLYEMKKPIKQIIEKQSKMYLKAYNEAIWRCRIQATEFSLYCGLSKSEYKLMKIHLKYNSFTIFELEKTKPTFQSNYDENSFFLGINSFHPKLLIFSKVEKNINVFAKLKSRHQKLVIVFLFLIYRSTIQKNTYVGQNPEDFSKKNINGLNTEILPPSLPIDPKLSRYYTNPLNILSKIQNTNKNNFNHKIIRIISNIWKDGGTKFQVFFLVNKTVPFEPGILYIKKRGILEILQNQIINNHQFSQDFKLTQTQNQKQHNLIKISSKSGYNKSITFLATNSTEETLFISKTILFFNKQFLNIIKK
ncbi:hypothetical protein M0813_27615 [Anaeramoeba flamelloides]|uniref:Uncharacterized protein n=1 Tax=Anaeramoeba flamelloides TaxID=1746091 RepID=A0ABQ8XXF5_9EUKA|nr:hypothetical protein M0813_27615 [Anaeramoeba flamelloides]